MAKVCWMKLGFVLALLVISATRDAAAQSAERPPQPTTAQAAQDAASSSAPSKDWDHLRLGGNFNFSKDPSHYDGPRSSYLIGSWTTSGGTLFHVRLYLDHTVRHEVNDKDEDPTLALKESIKEIYVRRKFAGFEVTAGDIRATAHSDNNKALYTGDGKPLHNTIVEIDRVLGVSVGKSFPVAKVEMTLADRGRKDLEWDGLMEALRVSRSFGQTVKDLQFTFVNRTGPEAGHVAAPHQWQTGLGGSFAAPGGASVVSVEYVHANFLSGRPSSTDAFSVAVERKLLTTRAVSLVADYEHINGATGVNFYEAGAGLNAFSIGAYSYVRAEGGWRIKRPEGPGELPQDGAFVRIGIVFDRGKGSVKSPHTLDEDFVRPRDERR